MISATRSLRMWLFALMVVALASAARAQTPAKSDLVGEWMATAAAERVDWFERTPANARADAVTALAMFEAANAIQPEYPSYLGVKPTSPTLPVEAAVSAAASHALALLYPDKRQRFEPKSRGYRWKRLNGPKLRAVMLGERVAEAAFARGAQMTTPQREPGRTPAGPGVYVPPEGPSVISAFDLQLRPWALTRADKLRPPPPPGLAAAEYGNDVEEVRLYGGAAVSRRTPFQTETARFWFFNDVYPVLRTIAARPGRSLARNARMYAMVNMAADDGWLATAEAKTHYWFWRPVTAITSADKDGNPATTPDPAWSPLLPTPAHPEYPCAHCAHVAAQAEVIEAELTDPTERFLVKSSTAPEAEPRRVSLREYLEQTSLSRIYAGAHYRFSIKPGEALGKAVGRRVILRWSTPHRVFAAVRGRPCREGCAP